MPVSGSQGYLLVGTDWQCFFEGTEWDKVTVLQLRFIITITIIIIIGCLGSACHPPRLPGAVVGTFLAVPLACVPVVTLTLLHALLHAGLLSAVLLFSSVSRRLQGLGVHVYSGNTEHL